MTTRVSELEAKVLAQIGHLIDQALNLDQVLDKILEILSVSLAMQWGAVSLREGETGLAVRAARGLKAPGKNGRVEGPEGGLLGLIFSSGQPLIAPAGRDEPIFFDRRQSLSPLPLDKGEIAFMGVPIVLSGSPLGVLSVDRLFGEDVPYEADVRFLSTVAGLIAQFVSLNKAVKAREEHWRRENLSLRAKLSERYQQFSLVGKSPAMEELKQQIKKVAPAQAAILLVGESGSGKTLIARIIHELSPRARRPFIKVNCASGPENLLAGELFGYDPGAFKGASRARPGRFAEADGGTIFLDEIGGLTPALQAKVLRVLQDRQLERLGRHKTRKVEVRLIAASSKDLSASVRAGLFLEDLYYCLSVFPLHLPPLRERREDLVPLLNHFLDQVSREHGCRFYLTRPALAALINYDWPGNVREMENLVKRLAILVEGPAIDLKDLPPHLIPAGPLPEQPASTLPRLKDLEKREIIAALARHRWIQSQAAMELGLTLRQIGYRVKRYGLENLIKEGRARGTNHEAQS